MTALKALEKGDADAALDALATLSPQERRKLAPKILSLCKEWHKFDYSDSTTSFFKHGTDEQREAAKVCAVAVATASEIVRGGRHLDFALHQTDAALSIVSRLRPPWLNEEGLETLADNEKIDWYTVEALITAGYCQRPSSDKLIESLIASPWAGTPQPASKTELAQQLSNVLRKYPGLFEDGVLYRFFEVEGGQQSSLAVVDKYYGYDQWITALRELSQTGELDRGRLLDGCLDALSRDFIAFRASWFSRFHDLLDPSDEEVAARKDAYLRLTGSTIPRTVGFAVKMIERLAKLGQMRPADMLAALPPALQSRQKGVVKRAAKLVVTAGRQAPSRAANAIETLSDGLVHPDPDVQKSLLDAIDALWPLAEDRHEAFRQRLAEARGLVAPSLHARLPGGQDTEGPREAEASEPAAVRDVEADPFADQYALTYAGNLDESIDMAAYALEHDEDPIAQELAFDAIARFRPATEDWETLTGPLRKRAEAIRNGRTEFDRTAQSLLAWLILAWVERRKPPFSEAYHGFGGALGFYVNRVERIAGRVVAGKTLPLLSTPTHRAGHTTYKRFLEVLDQWTGAGEQLDPYDAVLALMRLPAGDRVNARRAINMPAAKALDMAADTIPPEYTHRIKVWTSGEFRYYDLHIEPLRLRGLDLEPRSDLDLRQIFVHGLISVGLKRWCATVTPDDFQAYFAAASPSKFDDDDPLTSGLELEPARYPWVELGPEGHWLLMLMLAARGARAIEVALDVAIDGISQGRADADQLGGVLATLMTSSALKARRVAATFAQIATVSPQHAGWVRRAIARGLRGDPAEAPRDVGALLSLLHELLVEAREGLDDREARNWLETARRGGQVAKMRKAILAL